ncbi:Hsm3p Ecym_6304 [Eremothecium cymbalariae DBVPG|uniref:DNA mismatch repair protein HSM3 n=1 Tax=Eremothecium cymbalariae (strain CBS 270.75 / DBVPG 7215 / KCTC 17166 / NRRL Y-17582) TaxID=931890 RepID=G8JUA4_ERECY|nr:hypothetical protein Ecym_6304 [Eremothecium cymbalariae DBVPG\
MNTQLKVKKLMDSLTEELMSPNNTSIVKLNSLIDTVQLNLAIIANLEIDPKQLMSAIKYVLSSSEKTGLDYTSLIALLDTLLRLSNFEDVLQVFSVDDIMRALQSNITPLIQCACKILTVSYPKDLFSTTNIVDVLLKLYFKEDTVVISGIEVVFQSLCVNQLIRRRILENNYPLIKSMRETSDVIMFSRLLELFNILIQHIERSEFLEDLFILNREEIKKSLRKDIFLFINVTKYYQSLLRVSTQDSKDHTAKAWALNSILPVLPVFGYIYLNKNRYVDVHSFAMAYLFQLFRAISYLEGIDILRELDIQYLHISMENDDISHFLATLNPSYFLKYHVELLQSHIFIKPSMLQVVKNIISCKETFEVIKPAITSDSILAMPYTEQMILLKRLSEYPYSAEYLIQELPKVITNLITNENGPVRDPETVELRKRVFENLLNKNAAILNVWYEPILDEYSKICYGKRSSSLRTEIADAYL